jgi:hypothetical protein
MSPDSPPAGRLAGSSEREGIIDKAGTAALASREQPYASLSHAKLKHRAASVVAGSGARGS